MEKLGILLGANYSYQRALIVTDPSARDYNNQIPYTPRVSGSGRIGIKTPWIDLSYSLLWSGKRYAVNQNYTENNLPAYADHSISVNKDFKTTHYLIHANVEVLNLLDSNYEIVRWFPMPGRSFRATVSVRF